MKQYW